jgi:hypothetical protein
MATYTIDEVKYISQVENFHYKRRRLNNNQLAFRHSDQMSI